MTHYNPFFQKNLLEKIDILKNLTQTNLETLKKQETLSVTLADTIIENCVGVYGVPFGISPNIIIDGKTYHAPMATEEPSVIAAATYGASLIARSGGFKVISNNRAMIGQIAFDVTHLSENALHQRIEQFHQQHELYLNITNNAYPSIVMRGGGAKSIWHEVKISRDEQYTFLIIYLAVDTKEAMGANMMNTMLEALKPELADQFQCDAIMAILSNYALKSLVHVRCALPFDLLKKSNTSLTGEQVCRKIVQAYQFATADVFRATTHNKGIMNGVSAIVLATGNDTRAIEAGVHAFASQSGSYQPLTTWAIEDNHLVGNIILPLPIGTVGGSIQIHPVAKIAHAISNATNAKQLAALIASVGLAQNLAALRALVSEGIQFGHMRLQLKSLALSIGAQPHEIDAFVQKLSQQPVINQSVAKAALADFRQEHNHEH